MSLKDRQSVFQDVSSRTSLIADPESIRLDLQKRIRFMKLQLEESQELIRELEGEKVVTDAALKSHRQLVADEQENNRELRLELMSVRDALEPIKAMLAEERSSKHLIQEELQKCDSQVRALLLKEIEYRKMLQETEEACRRRISAEQEMFWRQKFEEENNRLLKTNGILSSQLDLLSNEKKTLLEHWDREREVLLKQQHLENSKMLENIRSKDSAIEKLSESLRSKDEALEGFALASKSQTSALKQKNAEHQSIMQQASAVARISIPEIRMLKQELIGHRQTCLQMFSCCQQDILMIQSCVIELSEKHIAHALLHSKLERMFEAAAEVACDASNLFARAVLAHEQ
jgi:hypothetical protein